MQQLLYTLFLAILPFALPALSVYADSPYCSQAEPGNSLFAPESVYDPVADFSAEPEECSLKVFFTSLDTNPDLTHFWDFGNGQYSDKPSPNPVYLASGTYTVTHTVISATGTDTDAMLVNVGEGVPFGKALFETIVRQCENGPTAYFYPYNMDGDHSWDFGDGETGTGPTPQHTYSEAGTYSVTHTVETNLCSFSKTYLIKVHEEAVTIGEPGQTTTFEQAIADTLLPPQEATGTHFYIQGTLKLSAETGFYKFRNCNIRMAPGARIVVESGTWLNIGQVSAIYSCDQMWFGIEVMPGATVRISERTIVEDAQYALYMHDQSTLSSIGNFFNRNYIGIYMPPPQGDQLQTINFEAPLWGNRFWCNRPLNNEFNDQAYEGDLPSQGDNSFAGILLNRVKTVAIGNIFPYTYSYFSDLANGIILNSCQTAVVANCLFENILYQSYYPDISGYGLWAEGTGGGLVYQRGAGASSSALPFTPQDATQPSFYNCTTGIYVNNTGIDCADNKMQAIAETGIKIENASYSTIRIKNNQIQSQRNGITLRMCAANPVLEIKENLLEIGEGGLGKEGISLDMINGKNPGTSVVSHNQARLFWCPSPNGSLNGIHLNQCARISVLNNFLRLEEPGGPTTDEISGIKLDDCNQLNVSCNEVEAFKLVGYMSRGIWTNNCGNIQLRCNATNNTGYGFQFSQKNYNVDFSGNFMNRHFYALHIPANSQLTSTTANSAHENRGNEWWYNPYNASDPNLLGGLHEGNSLNIFLSRFTVYPDFDYFINPTPMDPDPWSAPYNTNPDIKWFTVPDYPPLNVDGCLQNCNPGLDLATDPVVTALDQFIAEDQTLWAESLEGIRWNARQYLYAKLHENQHLIQPYTAIDSFYSALQHTAIPAFFQLEQEIRDLIQLSPREEDSFGPLDQKTLYMINELRDIDLQLGLTDGTDNLPLVRQRQSLMTELGEEANQQFNLQKEAWKNKKSMANALKRQNREIHPLTRAEEYQQKINEIFLTALFEGKEAISPDQSATLFEIASLCPPVAGRSVYTARGLYGLIEDVWFPENGPCSPEQNPLSEPINPLEKPLQKWSFSTYPNPASGQLFLSIPQAVQETPLLATLFDENGKALKGWMLPKHTPRFDMNLKGLPGGAYWLRISSTGETLWMNKVLIVN